MARQVELIVEDGTIVTGANSFVSEQEVLNYFLARGVALPNSTDEEKDAVAVFGIKAMDYLYIQNWKGLVVDPSQPTPWPRKNIGVFPQFPNNAVPAAVKQAQLSLALIVHEGGELIPYLSGAGVIIKDKIGPIETQYSEKFGVSDTGLPILPGVDALLSPWVNPDLTGVIPVSILSVGDKHGR